MLTIFVVSDATGETAERVVRSALVQFEGAAATVVRRGRVRTPDQVREVVQEASTGEALILHTLVSDELRRLMLAESRLRGVDAMDVMGPILDRLAVHLRLTPREKPGLFRQLNEARTRQIEAVEFAFRHDDGQHADELGRAEVVLVGVSRTMKTPTMLFLAYRGWFAANVPLVLDVEPPATLLSLPPERIFCLEMSPARLVELRRARAEYLGIPPGFYADLSHVQAELRSSQQASVEHNWKRVNVTGKSVEEVAREIMALLPREPDAEEMW
jgi:regulator of PEP synthase PpsR (kinase-PPPase family)